MKIRTGFVSNSSSSSFCLGKAYMTSEQIKEFNEWIDKRDEEILDDSETWAEESKYYFIGRISDHNKSFREFINKLEVKEYIAYGD